MKKGQKSKSGLLTKITVRDLVENSYKKISKFEKEEIKNETTTLNLGNEDEKVVVALGMFNI